MKFLESIQQRLQLLEQEAAPNKQDAAMPSPSNPNDQEQPPTPAQADAVDEIGDNANDQVQENIKLCADIIHQLTVWVSGKFNELIPAIDPQIAGTFQDSVKQLNDIEKAAVVTNLQACTPELLQRLNNLISNLPSEPAVQEQQ